MCIMKRYPAFFNQNVGKWHLLLTRMSCKSWQGSGMASNFGMNMQKINGIFVIYTFLMRSLPVVGGLAILSGHDAGLFPAR